MTTEPPTQQPTTPEAEWDAEKVVTSLPGLGYDWTTIDDYNAAQAWAVEAYLAAAAEVARVRAAARDAYQHRLGWRINTHLRRQYEEETMRDPVPVQRLTCHKGHRYYVGGGSMDGQVTHLVYAASSDYPQTVGTQTLGAALGVGSRSWYELDYEASEGTEAVYRFIGVGKTFPQKTVGDV